MRVLKTLLLLAGTVALAFAGNTLYGPAGAVAGAGIGIVVLLLGRRF